ncbi:TIGR03936 family radical SAM-associated protein [Alkaliphilus peptidifermentans]|uniref:Radical SAM-linked protein n=1 Tax=Alkaliphilus peptidifermentans DSM 18978 TaxID=1120976 RepID=A0A1G5DL42_9FIRM|nr:TIGR03936 family radical SAM-associated protein [Alkaliphilus peptidifermentans]SCY15425.1 radical SAM-linked protein [Alkaliphilus peptidifermentans DSM 18978]
MFRLRARFSKNEDLIFISHLDLMRVFERAMRRANIPISHTQGFNPHPIMAFATALGLGISSAAEYIDIQLDEEIQTESFVDRLNNVLPNGLKIIQCTYISSKEESLMAVIKRSVYLVKVSLQTPISKEELTTELERFTGLEEIVLIKEKKKKGRKNQKTVQHVDIRPNIYSIELLSLEEEQAIFKMNLAAGSVGNLKPEIVIEKLMELTQLQINLESMRIHRLELFKEVEGTFVTPLEDLKSI